MKGGQSSSAGGRGRYLGSGIGQLLGLIVLHINVLSILGDERGVGRGTQRDSVLKTTTSTSLTSTEHQATQTFLRFLLRFSVESPVTSVVVLLIRSLMICVTLFVSQDCAVLPHGTFIKSLRVVLRVGLSTGWRSGLRVGDGKPNLL